MMRGGAPQCYLLKPTNNRYYCIKLPLVALLTPLLLETDTENELLKLLSIEVKSAGPRVNRWKMKQEF
jgi:hypothetical protein